MTVETKAATCSTSSSTTAPVTSTSLNLVDESDLLALLEDGGYEVESSCKVKCEAGAVNTDCPSAAQTSRAEG